MVNSYPLYLDELEELLVFRCQQLMKHHDLIQGLTCFHWWPRAMDVYSRFTIELRQVFFAMKLFQSKKNVSFLFKRTIIINESHIRYLAIAIRLAINLNIFTEKFGLKPRP